MAKLSIEVNSDTDECIIKVDGKVVEGIRSFFLSGGYDYEGHKYASFQAMQEVKDPSGLNKSNNLTWSTAGLEKVDLKTNMKKLK